MRVRAICVKGVPMRRGDVEEQRRHFRAKLAEAMDRLDLKGYELARLVGVNPGSVTGWRQGALPAGQRLADLAKVLKMTPEDLVPGTALPAPSRNRAPRPDYVAGALDTLSEIEIALKEIRDRVGEARSVAARGAREASDVDARARKVGSRRRQGGRGA